MHLLKALIYLGGECMLAVKVGGISLSKDGTVETKPAKVALASLYEEYYGRIVRYIFIRINDQSEAENLGGDVFLRALQSLDSFRGRPKQMIAWLFSIARNLVVDHVRKMSRRKEISIDEVEIPDKQNIGEAVEKKSELERLSQAVEQLTPAQREVIGLRFFAELSSAEVGKILGRSSGAVREMQRAAIETLRKQMNV
jgi:RNA polymerase sigma-70 factor (ECF subfamily)